MFGNASRTRLALHRLRALAPPPPTGLVANRGRALALTALAVFHSGCSDTPERGPVSAPLEGAETAILEGDLAYYPTAAETLFVRPVPEEPSAELHLLFYRGRGVARDADGVAFVPDPQGSRVLVVGTDLTVSRVIGGPTEADGGLGEPLAAAPTPDGGLFVADTEHAAGLLYFGAEGAYKGAAAPPITNPDFQAGPDGSLWAARSPYVLRFEETALDEPLLYRFDPLAGTGVGIATVEPVAAPAWNRVVNAGPVAAGENGDGYFAFFLRNELRGYSPTGDLLWRSSRALHYETYEPVFAGEGESLRYNVRPVTQAMTMGPDGKLYTLTASDSLPSPTAVSSGGGDRRVEVWDPATGALLRASRVSGDLSTFAVDREGRVYYLDPAQIDASAPPPERAPLPRISLVSFEGDTTSFSDHRGKALLVNLWASWCIPCREELPRLKEYYGTLDHDRVEFLAISVDEDPQAAIDFISPFEVGFPLFYGGPGMQERFHYIGLPFTVIVDPRGRIVEEIHGFGSAETWDYLTGKLEEQMAEAEGSSAPMEGHEGHQDMHQDESAAPDREQPEGQALPERGNHG